MNGTKLDQLPDLCLRKVFEFLNLRDRVKCRSVCRLFKFYGDETRVDELVVKNSYDRKCGDYSNLCSVWYLTNREIDPANTISEVGFFLMRCSLKLDQRLRFLHVHLGYAPNFDFKLFNDLKQLVHLEIRIIAKGDEAQTLALPNLKVFHVQSCYVRQHWYVLNTPKLEVLACNQIEKIQLKHPEILKRLECEYRADPVAKFKNLEVLTCLDASYKLSPISLSDWKHLKELNLVMVSSGYNRDKYEQFMSWVVSLIRQKAELQRDELKLYLADVLLVDEKQLMHRRMANSLDLMLKYPQFIRPGICPHVNELQFERLVELGVELSTEFFDRFSGIRDLTACGPVEPHSFGFFLENTTALCHLTLERTLLDQTFMNRLPNIASQLNRLEVWSEGSRLITDFNFILRLEQLWVLETDHQFDSLELVAQAYRQLKEFVRVQFRAGRLTVEICLPFDYEKYITRKEGSEEVTRKDEYRLQINNEYGKRKLLRGRVKWAKLVALYEQKKAELADEPVEPKAKRFRLR